MRRDSTDLPGPPPRLLQRCNSSSHPHAPPATAFRPGVSSPQEPPIISGSCFSLRRPVGSNALPSSTPPSLNSAAGLIEDYLRGARTLQAQPTKHRRALGRALVLAAEGASIPGRWAPSGDDPDLLGRLLTLVRDWHEETPEC